jgi:hypothetical protein
MAGILLFAAPAWCAHGPHRDSNGAQEEKKDADDEAPKTLLRWASDAPPQGGPAGWDEPLASDRPDFTEASNTVGRGVAQLECGYTFLSDRAGADVSRQHSFPEALLRVGLLAEWLELRIAYNYSNASGTVSALPTDVSGSEDLYLGTKLGLTQQQGVLPEMAIILQMTVPTGSRAVTAGEVLPGVNWLYGWDLSENISTAGSTQFNREIDSVTGEPYLEFAQSWTIGYKLAEHWGAYTEFFTIVPDGADFDHTQSYFDGGFTFPVTNNLQFDVRAGFGVNAAADDFFAGSGAVLRF